MEKLNYKELYVGKYYLACNEIECFIITPDDQHPNLLRYSVLANNNCYFPTDLYSFYRDTPENRTELLLQGMPINPTPPPPF